MTELKRALIFISAMVIIIPLLMLLIQGIYIWGNGNETIAGKYLLCYDPQFTLGIKTGENTWDLYDEDMFIENIEHSDDFIIIYAMLAPREMPLIHKWDLDRKNDLEKLKNGFSPALYIIDVKQDSVYGPLEIKEYVKLREELGVPEDLILKVKMKL